MAKPDVVLVAGFERDLASISKLRRDVEQELSGIAAKIDPQLTKLSQKFSSPLLTGGATQSQSRELTAFENRLKIAQSAVSAQADALNKSKQEIQEMIVAVKGFSDRFGETNSATVSLKNRLEELKTQYFKEKDALAKLENELGEATISVRRFNDILNASVTTVGTPLPRTGSSKDIQLTEKDKKSLSKTFNQFEQLKGVAFDATGALGQVTGILDRAGNEIFLPVFEAQEKLANILIERFKQNKILAQQEANNAQQIKQEMSERRQNFANFAKAQKQAADDLYQQGKNVRRFQISELKDFQQQQQNAQKANDDANRRGAEALAKFRADQKKAKEKQINEELFAAQKEGDLNRRLLQIKQAIVDAEKKRLDNINRKLAAEGVKNIRGDTAQFKSLSDISSNAKNQLGTKDQQELVRILGQQEKAAQRASANFRSHNGSIAQGNALVKTLSLNLEKGSRAAFQFGFSARDAASRLVAWSAPASFMFKTIELLRRATNELVQLDSLARRLAFFQGGGDIEKAAQGFGIITDATEALKTQGTANISSIIEAAKRSGLSLQEVARGALTVQKIGQDAFEAGGGTGQFLDTVLALKRIEGAELDVARSAEILNATIQQTGASFGEASIFAAKFLDAANKTAFSVDELAVVVNGVLPAFKAIQGAGFDEVLVLAEIASKRLGTNASRVRTALRQLPTLAVKFADEIKKASGIEIINEDGTIRGVNSILEVLKVVKDLKGTVAGFNLGDQLAEQENISDILNLADAIEEITARFKQLEGGISIAAQRNLLEKFFSASEAQGDTLEATFNKLNTSIAELVNNSALTELFKSIAGGATDVVNSITTIVPIIKDFASELGILGKLAAGFALVKLGRAAGAFGAGFLKGAVGSQLSAESAQNLGKLTNGELNNTEAIASARNEGIISQQKSVSLSLQNATLIERERTVLNQKIGLEKQLEAVRKSGIGNRGVEKKLVAEIAVQEGLLTKNLKDQVALRNIIAGKAKEALAGTNAQLIRESRNKKIITAGSSLLVAGALIAGPNVAKVIGGDLGKASESALIAGLTAGSAAAVAGPIAAIGVGLAAALIAGLTTFLGAADEQAEELEKKRKKTLAISRAINEAEAGRKRNLAAAKAATEKQDILTRKQLESQDKIAELKERIQREGAKELDTQLTQNELLREQDTLDKINFELGQRKKKQAEDRLNFEREILNIKTQQERVTGTLNILESARLALLKNAGADSLTLENVKIQFDEQKLNAQLSTIRDRISAFKVELGKLGTQSNVQDEIKRVQGQLNEASAEELKLRQEFIQKEFDSRKSLLEIATSEANKQIDAWKSAASEVASAFKSVLDIQNKIADRFIDELEGSFADIDLKGFESEVRDSIEFGIDDSFRELNANFRRLKNGTDKLSLASAGTDALVDKVDRPEINIQKEVSSAIDEFKKAFSGISKTENPVLIAAREEARLRIDAARQSIENEAKQIDRINKVRQLEERQIRENINANKDHIKLLKDLISAEAQRGRQLIEKPEDVVKGFKSLLGAQGLFKDLGNGPEEAVKELGNRLEKIAKRPGGQAIRQNALKALEFASERNIKLSEAFNPKELIDVFLASVNNPKIAQNAVGRVEKERLNISEQFDDLRRSIDNQKSFQDRQLQLDNLLLSIDKSNLDIAQKAKLENKALLTASLGTFSEQKASVDALAKTILDTLGEPLKDVLTNSNYVVGTNKIALEIRNLGRVLQGLPGEENAPGFNRDNLDLLLDKRDISPVPILPKSDVNLQQQSSNMQKAASEQSASSKDLAKATFELRNVAVTLKEFQTEQSNSKQKIEVEAKVAPVEMSKDSALDFSDVIRKTFREQAEDMIKSFTNQFNPILESLDRGIKIADSNINVTVAANVHQQISASKDLEAVLLRLAGGDRQEMERLKEIMVKSIAREVERDATKVSVSELDFVGSLGVITPPR